MTQDITIGVGVKFSEDSKPNVRQHSQSVIYLIRNLINGKIYVGSAIKFYRRFCAYRNVRLPEVEACRTIERAIKKYGFSNFEFEILEMLELPVTKESITVREQYWIDRLKPYEKAIGYNMLKNAYSALGNVPSPETRKLLSEVGKRRGKEISKQRSRPVVQIDIGTLKIIHEFSSGKEASAKYGAAIYPACSRDLSTAYGFYWSYKDELKDGVFTPRRSNKRNNCYVNAKPIYQIAPDGSMTMWDTITSINLHLSFDFRLIGACCRGEKKSYNGFRWKWVEDGQIVEQVRQRLKTEVYENSKSNPIKRYGSN